MKRRAGWLATGLVLAGAAGCERYVAVGHEDALISAGGSSAGQAGVAGAAGSGLGPASWSANHELGSFDEWLGDGQGLRFLEGNGALELTTERAHSGSHAFIATITANDGAQHQAVMGRDLVLGEGRYGAWYYLPAAPRADYWVIMKLSNGPVIDRFDIDLEVPTGGLPHLRLYEHDSGWITEPSPIAFPIEQWVHVEALYRSTPDANGRVIVLQDGQQVVDSGPRATASDDHVAFFCGSSSRYVAPAPYRLFIDDASIREDVVP